MGTKKQVEKLLRRKHERMKQHKKEGEMIEAAFDAEFAAIRANCEHRPTMFLGYHCEKCGVYLG